MRSWLLPLAIVSWFPLIRVLGGFVTASTPNPPIVDSANSKPKVLILGGGVTGVIAARTLHRRGIDSFLILEARDELGGRMQSHVLVGEQGAYTIEKGPNWIQGPGGATDEKKDNPIYELALKHGIQSHVNDFDGSFSKSTHFIH